MASKKKHLSVSILCLPDRKDTDFLTTLKQLLEKYQPGNGAKVSISVIKEEEEITQALNSQKYDLHLLCAVTPEKTLNLLQRVYNHDLTQTVIGIVPAGRRDLGIQMIRAGASDFLDLKHLTSEIFFHAMEFARVHANQGFRIARRFAFERLLKNIASSLLNLPIERIEVGIDRALQMIGEHTNVERSYVILLSDDKRSFSMSYEWHSPKTSAAAEVFRNRATEDFRILFEKCRDERVVYYSRLKELPPEEQYFSGLLSKRGVKSFLAVPLFEGQTLIGVVGLSALQSEQYWSGEVVSLLEFCAEVFSNAIQRKKAHLALYDSEQRFRTLIEGLGEGILYCDRDDNIIHVNTRLCQMTGYSFEESIGKKSYELFMPTGQGHQLRNQTLRRLEGISESYELELQRKDGSTFWSRIAATPITDSRGEIVATLGAITDISEYKQAHEELKRQKEFLSLVIDTNPSLIYAKDIDGKFILVNQALSDLYGLPKEMILGKSVDDIYTDPELIKKFNEQDQRIIELKEPIVFSEDSVRISPDGEERWFQTTKKPLLSQSGEVVQLLGVSVDLTVRRRSEEALKAVIEGTATTTAEEFFRSLVRHLAQALGVDSAFLGTFSEDSNRKITTLAQWLGGEYRENSEYQVANSPSEEVLKNGFYLIRDGARHQYEDTEIFQELNTESYMGSALYDSKGSVFGLLVVFDHKELSDWNMARYILGVFAARASAELQRMKTQAKTIELQHQLVQAQKMEAIGQLAAGVAHDLNNALSAVVGHLQLMTMQSQNNPELHQSVKIALSGCERATSLIDHLLGFSRQGLYQPEKLSLQDVASECISFLRSVVGSSIRMDITGSQEQLWISADNNQLHQIFTNLIINAKQAMPDGGAIIFDLGSEYIGDPKPFNANARAGDYAVIRVCDTGLGIESSILNKIFEPFFTTKDKEKGTGLGLSMAYGAMQNHGGWIEVDSTPGEGTTFSLYFPRLLGSEDILAQDSIGREFNHDSLILVIDDEPFLVDLMLKFLENSGYKGKGFTNPVHALEWFTNSHQRVDLVILDMKMPRIDGYKCFHELKKINPAVRVAILSGYIQDRAAQELMEAGALAFFQKPLKYPEIIRWIDETLEQDPKSTISDSEKSELKVH